jgi:hypothetical protein
MPVQRLLLDDSQWTAVEGRDQQGVSGLPL